MIEVFFFWVLLVSRHGVEDAVCDGMDGINFIRINFVLILEG